MRATLQSATLDAIGTQIVSGGYAVGQVLRAEDIEIEHQVSRTVLREALKVLESMHLIEMRRKVGITIRPRSEWNVFDPRVIRWRLAGSDRTAQLRSLTSLRVAIEPQAASLAADAATSDQRLELMSLATLLYEAGTPRDGDAYIAHDTHFHALLLQASGNEMFAALSGVVTEVITGRIIHGMAPENPTDESLRLHLQIARSVANGEGAAAEQAARELLAEVAEQLVTPDREGLVAP